jgi:hypothetical protein
MGIHIWVIRTQDAAGKQYQCYEKSGTSILTVHRGASPIIIEDNDNIETATLRSRITQLTATNTHLASLNDNLTRKLEAIRNVV